MNNELYHYGVPGMKWGVRKDSYSSSGSKSSSKSRFIGFGRDRHTNYEIKRARKIANAGQYNGKLMTAARTASAALTIRGMDQTGRILARSTRITAAKLAMQGNLQAATIAKVGGASVWAAMMAVSAVNIERNIAAEVYGRNENYRNKIDSIANEKLSKER